MCSRNSIFCPCLSIFFGSGEKGIENTMKITLAFIRDTCGRGLYNINTKKFMTYWAVKIFADSKHTVIYFTSSFYFKRTRLSGFILH